MSVTFSHNTSTYDPETDTNSNVVTVTVTGSAIAKLSGADDLFGAGTGALVGTEKRLLLFTADTYGDAPGEGDTVLWEGNTWTVESVKSLAPDGVVILSYVLLKR